MPSDPTVILTRESEDNLSLAALLNEQKVPFIDYPCIKTTIIPFKGGAIEGSRSLDDYSLLVFTSKRGVRGAEPVRESIQYSGQAIAVVGDRTAKEVMDLFSRSPRIIASPPTGKALAEEIKNQFSPETRILHFRGNKTTGSLKKSLESGEYSLTELIVYHNETPDIPPLTLEGSAIVVLSSPSAAKGFISVNKRFLKKFIFVAIGSSTLGYLRKIGVRESVFESQAPSPDAILKTIQNIIKEAY